MLVRNLNYSILNGDFEQETALEDMHMFFVAFNKKQKRIVEYVEEPAIAKQDQEEVLVVEGNVMEEKVPITVLELEELDLD